MSAHSPDHPRPPLVDPRHPVRLAARHLARQHDPQCCPTDDLARAGRVERPAPMDRRLLHARLRRPPAHHGRARRPLQPPRRPRRRSGDLRNARRSHPRSPTSATMLITTRALMGVGGALIMPTTLSILTNVFPAHERPKAIGIWAAVAGIGVGVGPRGRRLPDRAVRLDRRVPGQRPDRDRRAGRHPEAGAGLARPRAVAARPARRRAVDRGPRHPDGRDHPGARLGLDRRQDPRRLRRRGRGARRLRRPGSSAPPRRCSTCGCSASAASPARAAPSRWCSSRSSARSSS